MGMHPNHYDRELIRRTLELIESYQGEYTITLLMNSLLSLVVLPKESNQRNLKLMPFLKRPLTEYQDIEDIISREGNHFELIPKNNKKLPPRNLEQFLRRVRNSISHQDIIPISSDNNKWVGVILNDKCRDNSSMRLQLSVAELKAFAVFIANSYLNDLNKVLDK